MYRVSTPLGLNLNPPNKYINQYLCMFLGGEYNPHTKHIHQEVDI